MNTEAEGLADMEHDMTDIVERLRRHAAGAYTSPEGQAMALEAADEITALRELLRLCRAERDDLAEVYYENKRLRAAQQGEPVAWECSTGHGIGWFCGSCMPLQRPLFAAPQQRQPLKHMQIVLLWGHRSDGPDNSEIVSFARAVEAAHGIGEKQ